MDEKTPRTKNEFLQYFVKKTDEKFSDIKEELSKIHSILDDLKTFKIQMLSNSKWLAMIVSAIFGVISMIVSAGISYHLSQRNEKLHAVEVSPIRKAVLKPEGIVQ